MDVPVIEIKKILYPTDLSQSGREAFSYAASLAKVYDAEITVYHVVEETPKLNRSLVGYISDSLWEEIRSRNVHEAIDLLVSRKRDNTAIKKCIGEYCEDIQASNPEQADVTYDIAVGVGDPVEKIVAFCEEGNFDLIVIGRHGHGLLKAAIMGDTARRVIWHAKAPVLVVRVPDEDDD